MLARSVLHVLNAWFKIMPFLLGKSFATKAIFLLFCFVMVLN